MKKYIIKLITIKNLYAFTFCCFLLSFCTIAISAIETTIPNNYPILDADYKDSLDVKSDPDFELILGDLDAYWEIYPEDYEGTKEDLGGDFSMVPLYKVFFGNDILRIMSDNSTANISSALKGTYKIVYATKPVLIGDDVCEPYGATAYFYRDPTTQTTFAIDNNFEVYEDFLKNYKTIFSSANVTKDLDTLELSNVYFFADDYQKAIIYCVTNHGNYIYFSHRGTNGKLEFVFPEKEFSEMLYRILKTNGNDCSFSELDCLSSTPYSQLSQFLVGGEEALKEKYPDYATLYNPSPVATEQPSETLPSATETEPIIIDIVKPFNVFKLLFFVETAVVVVSAVIFTVIYFKKKRIKQ
ncbi:MAG: hypothetical protein E7642_08505 [Ruminococcaceae bacterium]|nr:hypothetical protein [Oscillospiraceae bacterium]